MWIYEKRLQYPVNIKKTCPKTASLIISQFGGPDGELAASMRYLSQRYTMPCREAAGLLTDIGTEELAHLEIICAMVFQLTKDLTAEQAKTAGFDAYYIDHATGLWPAAGAGHSHKSRGCFRLPQAFPTMPVNSSLRETPSQTFMKTWLQNRKPGAPTKTLSALLMIRMYWIHFDFCVPEKSSISSGSVKLWKR